MHLDNIHSTRKSLFVSYLHSANIICKMMVCKCIIGSVNICVKQCLYSIDFGCMFQAGISNSIVAMCMWVIYLKNLLIYFKSTFMPFVFHRYSRS